MGCPAFETISLMNKSLWFDSVEAKLVFETHAGQAWGTLHVSLGQHLCRPQPSILPQEQLRKKVSPAKQRRRDRREQLELEQKLLRKKHLLVVK